MTMQPVSNQTPAPTTPEQGQPQAQTGQPLALTQEQLDALLKQAEDRAFQRAQSYVDKGQTKVREKMTEMEKVLAAAGMTLDTQARQRMEQTIREQVMAEPDTPTTPAAGIQPARIAPPQPAQAAPTPGEMDPITAKAHGIMMAIGAELEDGDPEIAMIVQTDPDAYLNSIIAAANAKKQRTSNQPTNNRPAPVPGAGYGGQAAGPYAGQKGFDLIKQHYAARK